MKSAVISPEQAVKRSSRAGHPEPVEGSVRLLRRVGKALGSFTLVELLVVMAIIAILVALVLGAGNGVMIQGMRARAKAEIQAMSTAAESYKTDNGIYPQSDGNLVTNSVATPYNDATWDGTSTEYQTNSFLLFSALSGQTNFTVAAVSGTKAYMSFKPNQVTTPASGFTYVHDPWGAQYSYGYSTGASSSGTYTAAPYNGAGFFDLWSTAGSTASSPNTNTWISNWTQ